MDFNLCYKSYPFKVTWAAKREFKRETGRGLWSTIQGILPIMANSKELSVSDRMQKVSEYIDEVDGTILLWILAKQSNSTLQLSEIVDALNVLAGDRLVVMNLHSLIPMCCTIFCTL